MIGAARRTYHVSQEKDEKSPYYKKWRIRLANSSKSIRFYDTQKEAIEEAEELARKYKGSIVIHKLDGTMRKQNYSPR